MLLTPHAGSEPRPLGKGASGGELSRIMLAIEVVLAGVNTVPSFVFDEVDAGIGGKVAVEVGPSAGPAGAVGPGHRRHAPAAGGGVRRPARRGVEGQRRARHGEPPWRVVDGPRTRRELVRMLSGLEDSQSGAEHAAELLSLGEAARASAVPVAPIRAGRGGGHDHHADRVPRHPAAPGAGASGCWCRSRWSWSSWSAWPFAWWSDCRPRQANAEFVRALDASTARVAVRRPSVQGTLAYASPMIWSTAVPADVRAGLRDARGGAAPPRSSGDLAAVAGHGVGGARPAVAGRPGAGPRRRCWRCVERARARFDRIAADAAAIGLVCSAGPPVGGAACRRSARPAQPTSRCADSLVFHGESDD